MGFIFDEEGVGGIDWARYHRVMKKPPQRWSLSERILTRQVMVWSVARMVNDAWQLDQEAARELLGVSIPEDGEWPGNQSEQTALTIAMTPWFVNAIDGRWPLLLKIGACLAHAEKVGRLGVDRATWLRTPSPHFGGRSPLEVMSEDSSPNLFRMLLLVRELSGKLGGDLSIVCEPEMTF